MQYVSVFLVYDLCFIYLHSSEDPYQDIAALLANYSSNPEPEPQLKSLLPQITSCFGADKSVKEITEELIKHQQGTEPLGELVAVLSV